MRSLILTFASIPCVSLLLAQTMSGVQNLQVNTITTAVPFLSIAPDATQFSKADVGVLPSDTYVESGFQRNPALLANGQRYVQTRINYVAWLRSIRPGINLYACNAAYGINSKHAVGLSYKYFDIGTIGFVDQQGNVAPEVRPVEFVVQANYAMAFSKHLSAGAALKYVYSDLTAGVDVVGVPSSPGQTMAADLGVSYRSEPAVTDVLKTSYDLAAAVTNLGGKIKYTDASDGDYIPGTLQAGGQYNIQLNSGKMVFRNSIAYQFSKLLVPTPPVYAVDATNGNVLFDANGDPVIASGYDPTAPVAVGVLRSFYDAPGGALEEIREYNHQAAYELRAGFSENLGITLRTGGFYEAFQKGARAFLTLGGGLDVYGFRVDAGRLFPFGQNTFLSGTFFVSAGYSLNILGEGD